MPKCFRLFSARLIGVGLALAAAAFPPCSLAASRAPAPEGIALAVVLDTSGSMNESIATKAGDRAPKSQIAERALGAVIARLESFAKSPDAKPLSVGVYAFVNGEAAVMHPLSRLNPPALRRAAATKPGGATPLGDTIYLAGQELLAAPAAYRHMLVLTDGANTKGRTPESALERINAAARKKDTAVFAHIVALDIKPATFAALTKHGASLIGATDEAQLNAQFDFILEEKILVEAPR